MPRGRPLGSPIRRNMLALLSQQGDMHGYELYKEYCRHYPKVSQRIIYYHLRKALALGELKARKERKKGTYSWGDTTSRILYKKQ